MRHLLNSALVVSLLCASPVAQTAQTYSPKSGDIPAQKPGAGREITPQQEQAISALNNLFERTKGFADEIRVETQAQIADTLWQYDRQTAQRQFTEAFRSIEAIEDEKGAFSIADTPKTLLRLGLLNLLAKRDADMAENLINSIPESQSKSDRTGPTKKRNGKGKLYLNLAMVLIPTDPQRAANLIPKVFNSGFSVELIIALKFLGKKEPEAADRLMRRALSEIQPDPEVPMMDLFGAELYFADDIDPANQTPGERKENTPEEIKPALVEPFLDFAYKAITIESANEQSRMSSGQKQDRMLMFDLMDEAMVAGLLPLFEKHQPERASFIRSRLGHIENAIPATVHQSKNTPRPTTVKELLDEAQAKNDPFQKDMLLSEAARKAEEAGDFDRAIAITEKRSDKNNGTDAWLIRNSAAISAGDKGDIDAAYRYAKGIPDPFHQARALCRIAQKSVEKKDMRRANELIDEAKKMIAQTGPTSEKVYALLEVAASVATIDPSGAFEVVNNAITTINQIQSAPSESISNAFETSLGMLARADFERAMKLALAITQSDVSVLAQLAVWRGVLVGPKN